MNPLDPTLLKEARGSRDKFLEAQHELERTRADYNHTIRRLHAEGGSLREIADDLGLSHQRVHQIVEGAEGGPPRREHKGRFGWPFERFTRRARQIIVSAQEEADQLGHNRVGSEHLLLGLVRVDDDATAPILSGAGITLDAVRERVAAIDPGPPRRRAPFTRAGKRVLETSVREAKMGGDRYIGAEHVLLGLIGDERNGSLQIVLELGADPDALRAAVAKRRAA